MLSRLESERASGAGRRLILRASILTLGVVGIASCTMSSGGPAVSEQAGAAISRQIGRSCPTPTPDPVRLRIAEALETLPSSAGIDVLATEWERLDEGSRRCRE